MEVGQDEQHLPISLAAANGGVWSNLILWGSADVIKSIACSHFFRSFEEYRSKPHKSKLLKPSDRSGSFCIWVSSRIFIHLYMTTTEIKTEIQMVLDKIPESVLQDVLDFFRELQGQSVDKIKLTNNLRQILSEDKELLERLAQ